MLLMTLCKPKPAPRPIAPPTTASAVRSIPKLVIPKSATTTIEATLIDFVNSTWTDGDNERLARIRVSSNPVR